MKAAPTDQKLRGGYYTPQPIAEFLARWAITESTNSMLEPSCGDGNILLEAAKVAASHNPTSHAYVYGIELESTEAQEAERRLKSENLSGQLAHIEVGDFFGTCQCWLLEGKRFDAIVGNPPFIRYQNWADEHRSIAFRIMAQAGLRPTRLTNSWVPFIVASTMLLTAHGRLAMVIPAELLQVSYAAELRQFLSDHYSRITVVTFRKLVFEGIQQEIVLVLGPVFKATTRGG